MRIIKLIWDEENEEHIARHQVTPDEVEELFFIFKGKPYIRRFRDIYHAFGQTEAGRYLFVVFRVLGSGQARVITAREMDRAEKRFYKGHKRKRGRGG